MLQLQQVPPRHLLDVLHQLKLKPEENCMCTAAEMYMEYLTNAKKL